MTASVLREPGSGPLAGGGTGRGRPRLLYVFNNPAFFVSHRSELAALAQADGFEVHVATPSGEAVQRILECGFAHHRWPMVRGSHRPDRELAALASLHAIYRRVQPDVVEHATIKPVIYGGLVTRTLHPVPVIHWVTGLGYVFLAAGWRARARRFVVRQLYRLALGAPGARTIFENRDNLDLFTTARLVRAGRAVVIPGAGVRLPPQVPPPAGGAPVVLLACRMLRDKGVEEFVAAARAIRAEGTAARFVLVGGPDPANPASIAEEQLRRWHADGAVEWWGHRSDMAAVFAASSIVCLPSYGEGLPKVLLEAAAYGRPLVATDVPGCRDVIRHGHNGLLVPSRAVAPLAAALRQLIAAPGLRREMGARARARVAQAFTLEHVAEQTIALYRDALQERSTLTGASG